jgi:hypothetical protein
MQTSCEYILISIYTHTHIYVSIIQIQINLCIQIHTFERVQCTLKMRIRILVNSRKQIQKKKDSHQDLGLLWCKRASCLANWIVSLTGHNTCIGQSECYYDV